MQLRHTLPAGRLSNGRDYHCRVTAYYFNNLSENSIQSSDVSFVTRTTPVFNFQNIMDGSVVRNASIDVVLNYYQMQNDSINEHRISLYSSDMNEIWNTGTLYGNPSPVHISGLNHNVRYLIRAQGTTVNDVFVDTGLVSFSVEFEAPSLYTVMRLENREREGAVKISSNIITISGISSDKSVEFINVNSPPSNNGLAVNLVGDNRSVLFNDNGKINSDYTVIFNGCKYGYNNEVFTIHSFQNRVSVVWRRGLFEDDDGQMKWFVYMELTQNNPYSSLSLQSNKILDPTHQMVKNWGDALSYTWGDFLGLNWGDLTNTRMYNTWIKCVNGSYEIKISDIGSVLPAIDKSDTTKVYNSPFLQNGVPALGHSFVLRNGIFDEVYVTTDTTSLYSTPVSDSWDVDTVLHAKLNGDLFAGNVDFRAEDVESLRIKRRIKGNLQWVTIAQFIVGNNQNSFNFEEWDWTPRSNHEYEYALVPIAGDAEGGYVINSVKTHFSGLIIMEKGVFFSSIIYDPTESQRNRPRNVVTTMGSKYPFVISHGLIDYDSISVSALFAGIDDNCQFNFADSWKYVKRLKDFLNNNNPKLIKKENGEMWLGVVSSSSINNTYRDKHSDEMAYVTFEFSEIGDCDDAHDLYNNKLIDVLERIGGALEIGETEKRLNQIEHDIFNLRKTKADDIELHSSGDVNLLAESIPIGRKIDLKDAIGNGIEIKLLD